MTRHRIPNAAFAPRSAEVDDDYQAEVDRSVQALTRRYEKAAKHLAALERRAANGRKKAAEHEAAKARHLAAAANRAESERVLTERLAGIKEAAKRYRVGAALKELDRRRAQAEADRRAATAARKAELAEARLREERLKVARRQSLDLDAQIEDRRRELREIEKLMTPGTYGTRDSRKRRVRIETGSGEIHMAGDAA